MGKERVQKCNSTKICKIQSLDLLFLVIFISFYITSADIFNKFLELHSTLSEKKIFVTNFPFLTDSLNTQPPGPPPPPPSFQHTHHHHHQNPLSVTKVFCQYSKPYHGFSRSLCYDDARKDYNSRAKLILQSNFNSRFSLSSYKPLDWG